MLVKTTYLLLASHPSWAQRFAVAVGAHVNALAQGIAYFFTPVNALASGSGVNA